MKLRDLLTSLGEVRLTRRRVVTVAAAAYCAAPVLAGADLQRRL